MTDVVSIEGCQHKKHNRNRQEICIKFVQSSRFSFRVDVNNSACAWLHVVGRRTAAIHGQRGFDCGSRLLHLPFGTHNEGFKASNSRPCQQLLPFVEVVDCYDA